MVRFVSWYMIFVGLCVCAMSPFAAVRIDPAVAGWMVGALMFGIGAFVGCVGLRILYELDH